MAITLTTGPLINKIDSNTKFSEFGSKIQETLTDFGNKMNTNFEAIEGKLDTSTQYTKAQEDSMLAERDATATKNLNVLSQAKADGISGFVDRDLDLEISEKDAVIGVKNRFAKFGNEVVDLYGPELVTNGDFSNGTTGWSTNATVDEYGSLNTENATYAFQHINNSVEIGKTYALYFSSKDTTDAVIYSDGDTLAICKDSKGGEYFFTPVATNSRLQFNFGNYNPKRLDNISVREIKSIDLAPTVPDVQTIGSTPLTVTNGTITGTDVKAGDPVGTDASIPGHNNGHQTKITCNVTTTTNGMEVQILDKSDSNNVIRTQTLDSHESKKTLEFWVPPNADGYYVHCIKRVNAGSGDESIVVTAKGYEDLVVTDVVEKSDYVVIDKEELVVNGTFDVDTTGWIAINSTIEEYKNMLKLTGDGSSNYGKAYQNINLEEGKSYYVSMASISSNNTHIEMYIATNISRPLGTFTSVGGILKGVFTAGESNSIYLGNSNNDNAVSYFDNISVTPVDDIFRATEDIPLGTSVYDSRFSARDYISNQQLVTLKQDANGTVTPYTETLFEDATETDVNLDRDNVMLKNGFSMAEDGLFTKGTDKHIIVGLWQTLNKGAYHPVFNFCGCRLWGGNPVKNYRYKWYESGGTYPSYGVIASSVCDSFLNTTTFLNSDSGRPDSKFYDVTYKDQFIELHTTIQEDTLFEAEKRRSAYYGGLGGVSGLVSTYIVKVAKKDIWSDGKYSSWNGTFTRIGAEFLPEFSKNYINSYIPKEVFFGGYNKYSVSVIMDGSIYTTTGGKNGSGRSEILLDSKYGDLTGLIPAVTNIELVFSRQLPILSSNTSLTTDIIGSISQYDSTDTTSALQSTSTDTGTELRQNALVWNVTQNRMYKYKDTDDRDNVDLTAEDFTVDAKWGYVEKGYPKLWLDRLSEGRPLIGMFSNLVDVNDGSSLIPDVYSNKLSSYKMLELHKTLLLTTPVQDRSDWTLLVNYANNTCRGNPSGTVYITQYTKANNPMQISDPKPITYVSPKVVNSDSHSQFKGALITNSITGGIATAT